MMRLDFNHSFKSRRIVVQMPYQLGHFAHSSAYPISRFIAELKSQPTESFWMRLVLVS